MKKIALLVFVFAGITILGFVKDDSLLQQIVEKLNKFTTSYPQEKIHLHLDKPYYAIGEDIWMKGYVVTAHENKPSPLSKVLYIDLIDQKNTIKQEIRLPITNGTANGHISISDTLKAGTYRIRSYTNYMRNYDTDFFFEQQLQIGDIFDIENPPTRSEANTVSQLSFFPEGGNLIYGIRSKVGIKATTKDGRGVNVSGFIADENNQKVAVFTTEHAGMGAFALTPQAGVKYKAFITTENGKVATFDFPPASPSGYSLAINTLTGNENLNFKLAISKDLIKGQIVNLIGQVNGVVYCSSDMKITDELITTVIPKKLFPTGIVQFTIISGEMLPVAERLVFINHADQLKIEVKANSIAKLKSKADFDLLVKDKNDNPIDGNFSVSVTDLGKVPINEDNQTTILSNLLLTSDLKGFVEQPNYYFNQLNSDKERQLDNLMLTQGWRRFVWKDVLQDKPININYFAEQGLEIRGKITTLNQKPLPNVAVMLVSTTPGFSLVIDTVSDKDGKFVFDRLEFPDTATFLIKAKDAKLANDVRIALKTAPSPRANPFLFNSLDISNYLQHTKKMYEEQTKHHITDGTIRLKEVKINAQKNTPLSQSPSWSANKNGNYDYIFKKDKLKNYKNLLDAFYVIPGVSVMARTLFRTSARTVSITNKNGSPSPMAVYLNGAPYLDLVERIAIDDVESVEVMTSNLNTSIYGPEGYWGVVLITTKIGPDNDFGKSTNIVKVKNRGLALVKEFYMPNYSDPKTNPQIQDLRSTIYWNPNINTAANGLGNFNFFTASESGTYRITVEGFDAFGNLGRKIFDYQVN